MTHGTHDTQVARLADETKRLADDFAGVVDFHDEATPKRTELHAAIDALRDLAIPAGEAVAWVWQSALDKLRSGAVTHIDAWAQPEDEPGEVALYASPQPTPEASQDGGAPLPGRESTAQSAFAGATRLALSDDMTYDRDGNLIDARGTDEADCSAQQKTDARAALAALPEPRAGEALCPCKDRPASQCDEEWGPQCSLGTSAEHAVRVSDERAAEIDAALGISLRVLAGNCHRFINVGDLKAAHFAINRLRLAASPIATPKPQERKPLTDAEIDEVREDFRLPREYRYFARAVEARAHGIVPQDGDRGEGERS